MRVRSLKLVDTRFKQDETHPATEGAWDYDDLVGGQHDDWFNDWISFDCVLADDRRQIVWCGLTRLNTDIFWAYDRARGTFRSLGFQKVADRYDAKFHRSLTFDKDGRIWAATALLHEIDRFHEAPGGAIVRFDPDTEQIDIVDRPLPHLYIQSLVLDKARGLLYGQAFTPETFFVYDIRTGRCENLGPLGSGLAMAQAEQLAIDRTGAVWGCWGVTRAWSNAGTGPTTFRLWRYHPDEGKRQFLDAGLPSVRDGEVYVKSDGAHAGPDGAVYMGTVEGTLCRVDPDTHAVDLLGKPAPGRRLAGMANGPDGVLYGSCGREGGANLFRYDPDTGRSTHLGPIFDVQTGEQAWQVHDMTITADGTIYAGENDVPHRSGYLWEITDVIRV